MVFSYKTIRNSAEGLVKEKGSKFFSYAFPITTEFEAAERLAEVRKLHPKARHFCYAWKLGTSNQLYRSNDDGEPSGTAGRPILGQIEKLQLTDIIVIVVRYFGGTLLGTGGLIQAYRGAAAVALEVSEVIENLVYFSVVIDYDYSMTSDIMHILKVFQLTIEEQVFELVPQMVVKIPVSVYDDFLVSLKAQLCQVSLEEANTIESIENFNIKIC